MPYGVVDGEELAGGDDHVCAVLLNMEFATHPVAGDLHLPAVCRGDREVLTEHRHQGFLDRRDDLVALFDLEGRMDVRERLVDLVELLPRGVLEEQRAPKCQELAVHLEGVVPVQIVDPQIAGHRDQLLVQHERLAGSVLFSGTRSRCRNYGASSKEGVAEAPEAGGTRGPTGAPQLTQNLASSARPPPHCVQNIAKVHLLLTSNRTPPEDWPASD